MNAISRLAALAGILLSTGPAWAEKADAEKPVNLEADRVSVDDVKKLQIFEGNVQLVKGTLIIRAERIVVSQDDDGYQRGVATGSGSAQAERIEHEARTEKTEFFGRARVKSGQDEVRGQYISYDARNEQYVVTSGPDGTRARPGSNERVRAVIQPKNKKEDAPATPPKGKPGSTSAAPRPAAPVPALKSAQDIANPREETPK